MHGGDRRRAVSRGPAHRRRHRRPIERDGIGLLLLLKLILVPTLIATVTLASRRWGPRVGGVLTALPLVAGPTLWFYAVEQGAPFAARAAHGTLLALISVGAYALAYAHASRRMRWPGALALAGVAWTAVTVVFYANQIPALPGVAVLAASCALAYWFMPVLGSPAGLAAPPRWDLTLRMVAAATLVLVLTSAAAWLGPSLSGFLASFPLATTILIAFTHAQRGPAAVVAFFRGFLPVLPMFGVFCVVLALTLGRVPVAAAFALALMIQIALQLVILWSIRRSSFS